MFINPRSDNESVLPFEASTVESSRILVTKVPESAICFERLVVTLTESADSSALARVISAAKPAFADEDASPISTETLEPSRSSLPANVLESALPFEESVVESNRILVASVPESETCLERLVAIFNTFVFIKPPKREESDISFKDSAV